jgi:hypothetical protein
VAHLPGDVTRLQGGMNGCGVWQTQGQLAQSVQIELVGL